jgi:MFS family permease
VLAATFGGFALFGVVVGTQGVLWAALMPALALSEGAFGTAQLTLPLVAMGVLVRGGPLAVRIGVRGLAVTSLVGLAGSLVGLAAARGLDGLLGALALQGVGVGVLEIALNAAVLDWERATGRRAMNLVHAVFSGGAVAGALGAGALLTRGVGYGVILVGLAVACLGLAVATLPVEYRARPPASGGGRPSLRALGRRPALRILAGLAVLAVVGESVANTWSVIYLTERGASLLLGGAAFALFNGAMAAGRLANARLVTVLGPRGSLLASGVGVLLAGAALVLPGPPSIPVAGFLVLGLAVAGMVPTVLSAAADAAPAESGAVTGGLLAAAYAAFVVMPPVIGWLAELASLRLALLTVVLSGGAIVWLAGRLPAGSRTAVPAGRV